MNNNVEFILANSTVGLLQTYIVYIYFYKMGKKGKWTLSGI